MIDSPTVTPDYSSPFEDHCLSYYKALIYLLMAGVKWDDLQHLHLR